MRDFFQHLFTRYNAWSLGAPFSCAFVTCAFKGTLSDLTAQKVIERRDRLNLRRSFAFACWGGFYLGCGQHVWYNLIFTRFFGAAQTTKATVQKVVTDSLVHVPLCCHPLYFTFENWALGGTQTANAEGGKESVEKEGAVTARRNNNIPERKLVVEVAPFTLEAAKVGFAKYCGSEGWQANLTYYQMWPLFHFVNFRYTPPHLRIACVAGFSYLWLIVLSVLSHKSIVEPSSSVH